MRIQGSWGQDLFYSLLSLPHGTGPGRQFCFDYITFSHQQAPLPLSLLQSRTGRHKTQISSWYTKQTGKEGRGLGRGAWLLGIPESSRAWEDRLCSRGNSTGRQKKSNTGESVHVEALVAQDPKNELAMYVKTSKYVYMSTECILRKGYVNYVSIRHPVANKGEKRYILDLIPWLIQSLRAGPVQCWAQDLGFSPKDSHNIAIE